MTTSNADQASKGSYVRQGLPSIIRPQHLGPVTGMAVDGFLVEPGPMCYRCDFVSDPADIEPRSVTEPTHPSRLCRTEQDVQSSRPAHWFDFSQAPHANTLLLIIPCQGRAPAQWAGYNSLPRLQDTTASNSMSWSRPFHGGLKPHPGRV